MDSKNTQLFEHMTNGGMTAEVREEFDQVRRALRKSLDEERQSEDLRRGRRGVVGRDSEGQ